MELKSIINDNTTDKNTLHSYIPTYELLFSQKKISATSILEVGINLGGSIKLWNDYFCNAEIYGIDQKNMDENIINLTNEKRIKLLLNKDAYNINENEFDIKFDVMIDDGSHDLEHQIYFLQKYLHFLKDDGIFIIEDVQNIEHIEIFKQFTPENYKKYIEVYDLRVNKGRYDDILFVINKNKII